ncbi:uncharacterized protein VTP21DRAFT_11734 [Calcarisporiella thermophila]|uniref:uncharacterized protein n=1 Tax=Calcarisporiella thermophila TaxID=911321 RepID=UPI003741FE5F
MGSPIISPTPFNDNGLLGESRINRVSESTPSTPRRDRHKRRIPSAWDTSAEFLTEARLPAWSASSSPRSVSSDATIRPRDIRNRYLWLAGDETPRPTQRIQQELGSNSVESFHTAQETLQSLPDIERIRIEDLNREESEATLERREEDDEPSNTIIMKDEMEIDSRGPNEEGSRSTRRIEVESGQRLSSRNLKNKDSMHIPLAAQDSTDLSPINEENSDQCISSSPHASTENVPSGLSSLYSLLVPSRNFASGSSPSNSILYVNRMLYRVELGGSQSSVQTKQDVKTFQIYSTWREYDVVVRNKTIELYKQFGELERTLPLSSYYLGINSPLDKTIALTDSQETHLFHLQCMTLASDFYLLLHHLLPPQNRKSVPNWIEVFIPDLSVRLRLPISSYPSLMSGDQNLPAEHIIENVLGLLAMEPEWCEVIKKWKEEKRVLSMCWRRRDRLEWIAWRTMITPNSDEQCSRLSRADFLVGVHAIERSHRLEIRIANHYPTSVHMPSNRATLREPPAVEGQLWSYTDFLGSKLSAGEKIAIITREWCMFILPTSEKKSRRCSAFYMQGQQGNASFNLRWIQHCDEERDGTSDELDPEQESAWDDMKWFTKVSGVIDLREIDEVYASSTSDHEEYDYVEELENEDIPVRLNRDHDAADPRIFTLKLKNGIYIVLRADTSYNAIKWAIGIYQLSLYWRRRSESDIRKHADPSLQEETSNQDLDSFWNWCVIGGCRPITMSGTLYRKHAHHRAFQRQMHILANGFLVNFKETRESSGRAVPNAWWVRSEILNLRDCYVYSGRLALSDEGNWLVRKSKSRPVTMHWKEWGMEDMPSDDGREIDFDPEGETKRFGRIYSDGTISLDLPEECTFCLWVGRQRRWYSTSQLRPRVSKKHWLGQMGKIFVFRARSRLERDKWVWALNCEIERMLREETRMR